MKESKFRDKRTIIASLVPYKPPRYDSVDMTGSIFNMLTVVGYSSEDSMWWCECICNKDVVFKVVRNSLVRGLTQSCGCLRKNNGTHSKSSLSDAQSKIHNFKIKKFSGWRSPCRGICVTCKTARTVDQAYSLRNTTCCKPPSVEYNKEVLAVRDLHYNKKNNSLNCKLCKQTDLVFNKPCICKLPTTNDISAVYILHDKTAGVFKIGKGDCPYTRSDMVIKSALVNEKLDFILYKILWVAGSSLAYRLESILHTKLKDYSDKSYCFDGSTETFRCSECIITKALNEENEAITLCNRGISPPPKFSINADKARYLESLSVEFDGIWFPTKISLSQFYHIGINSVNTLLEYENFKAFSKRVINRTAHHDVNWGDGIIGNIRQLARDYDIPDGCLWHRINKLGMSMKDALSLKVDSHKYYTINNKDYLKLEFSKHFGVCWNTVSKRINRGWDVKYAILDLGMPRGLIMNIAGTVYSKQQVLDTFNLKKGVWVLSKKLPTIRDVLLYHKVITKDDYFEIIPIP